MAKKKEGDKRGSRQDAAVECDLDDGYVSPITSFRDITFENIRSLVTKSRYIQALILLTIAGLFLRSYNLGYNSLWLDEATTFSISSQSFTGIWQTIAAGEFNPPLFYWIEHVMLLFGNSEAILRFVPAVLGVLTIPVFYLVGKEFLDRNTGLIAAAACTISPFLIYYSQEARAYSMMLFFVGLATFFFLKAMKSGNWIHWALFGVFSALGFWTHFYAIVMIAALVLYALIIWAPKVRTELNNLKLLVAGVIVFVILCLPLILVTISLFATRTSSAPTFGLQGLTLVAETFTQISGFSALAAILLVILFCVGIIQMWFVNRDKSVFLILTTVFIFAISYILSFKMPMQSRHLICISIVFFLGIACSYKALYVFIRRPAIVYVLIAALCIISTPMLVSYYSGYSKEDWRGFGSALQEKTNPGDSVVAVPGYMTQPLNYYYSPVKDHTTEFQATTGPELVKAYSQKGNGTMYFVVTSDIYAANPDGDAVAWLSNNTRLIGQDTGIFLFSSR
jgi:mannosyltransferase